MLAESVCELLSSVVPNLFRGKTGGRRCWLYISGRFIVLFAAIGVVVEALTELLFEIGVTTVLVGNWALLLSFGDAFAFVPSSFRSDDDLLLLEALFGDEVMLF